MLFPKTAPPTPRDTKHRAAPLTRAYVQRELKVAKGVRVPLRANDDSATRNVRFWLKADVLRAVDLCPLYPRKRTFWSGMKKVCF